MCRHPEYKKKQIQLWDYISNLFLFVYIEFVVYNNNCGFNL